MPAVPPPPALKEWTVLLYAEGKSSAEGQSLYAVNMLEEGGGSEGGVYFAAELSRGRGQFFDDPTDGDWAGSRRYAIARDDDFRFIRSPVLQSFDKVDMGDWRHLADFLRWGRANFPARRYALVILGHGSGWRDISLTKGLALDEETGRGIENSELARAIAESGGRLDLLVMNACLMQTAEALYDLRGSAAYIVGSENVMRAMPYDAIAAALNADPGMDAGRLAVTFAEKHWAEYGRYGHQNPTISAVDASRLPEFFRLLDAWSRAAAERGEKKAVRRQLDAAYQFDDSRRDSRDLGDLVRLVGQTAGDPDLRAKSERLSAFIGAELTLAARGADPRISGVAAYMPAKYQDAYSSQPLARETGWGNFLKKFR